MYCLFPCIGTDRCSYDRRLSWRWRLLTYLLTCIACLPVLAAGARQRRSRGRGRFLVHRLSQLGVRRRPGQLRGRVHGGNGGSRDRGRDDVIRSRAPVRRRLAVRVRAAARHPAGRQDAARRRRTRHRFHPGTHRRSPLPLPSTTTFGPYNITYSFIK